MSNAIETWKIFPRKSAYLEPLSPVGDIPEVVADPRALKLIDTYGEFLASRRLSPATVKLRLHWARRYALWLAGTKQTLLTAQTDDLDQYIYSNEAWSSATQVTIVATLRSLYGWALRKRHILDDPSRDLFSIRAIRQPARVAGDDAIRKGLDRATTDELAMILLGSECGLRVAEIATLRRNNRDGDWLSVTGKGSRTRSVWVSPELREVLETMERRPAREGYYFPGKSGGHAAVSTIWRHIRDLVGTNPHSLRHRAATTVYRGTGFDIRATQEFLGHASPTTTAVYVHVAKEDIQRAGQAARMAGVSPVKNSTHG
ncbi:MAG: tyrosine recombinase [Microbacteriaceae bacterium]|nr:tyrosine recombinase [Microbacteriaceae bacterium]